MRRLRTLAALALLVVAVTPTPAAAAQDDAGGLRIESVDTSAYPTIEAVVSAPAQMVARADDYAVREDGDEREVELVEQADAGDLQVVLLLDVTGSMVGPPLEAAKDAASSFLDQLPDEVAVTVVAYDTDVTVVSGFDATREEHANGIATLEAAGETAMYDAVASALDLFQESDGGGQALVLLTDGEDNASSTTIEEVVERLDASDVLLRGVEYQTAYSDQAGIRAMADATDGSVAGADDPEALVGVYEQLAADLINRSTLRYRSEGHGPVELAIELTTAEGASTATRTIELPGLPAAEETSSEAVAPEPRSSGTTSTSVWLIVGATLWFLALALLFYPFLAPRERRAQLAGAARLRRGNASELTGQVTALAGRTLASRGYDRGLNAALERAGINLRAEEFIVLVGSAVVTAFAVGLLLNGFLIGLVFAAVAAFGARLYLTFRIERRQKKFAAQLSDTLQLLSGSLRAGYSLMQAVDAVAREADAPASEEFGRLVVETRLGRDTRDALHAMAARMGGEDLSWVVQAIEIHREVGGDLAEVLDTVAGTVRERDQIRRQIKALSAEGRLSAWVLLALPFGVGGFIFLTNRPYLAELTSGGLLGWGMLAMGAVLMTVGVLWMRHLVKLEF